MPTTRPPYPAEFRQQMVELVASGRTPAEQLPTIDRWATLLGYICQRIVGPTPLPTPPPALPA